MLSTSGVSGAFCVSIDLELAWGIWDRPSEHYFAKCAELETRIVTALLERFERHAVPVTWAIVGRLLERDATAAARTRYGDAIWYAPHLIDAIREASPAHDIGSHGHSHRYFSELTAAEARDELAAAKTVHLRAGLPFHSFVFPRNQVAHIDALGEAGIEVFRSLDRGWFMTVKERAGRLAGRLAHLVDKALPVPPTTIEPRRHPGVVELPSSMLLLGRAGVRRAIPSGLLARKARLGLDAAARDGRTFHLWFHPSNFYDETARQLDALDEVLGHAAKLQRSGALAIRTMRDYAVTA